MVASLLRMRIAHPRARDRAGPVSLLYPQPPPAEHDPQPCWSDLIVTSPKTGSCIGHRSALQCKEEVQQVINDSK